MSAINQAVPQQIQEPFFTRVKTGLCNGWEATVLTTKSAASSTWAFLARIATAVHDFFAPKYEAAKTAICNLCSRAVSIFKKAPEAPKPDPVPAAAVQQPAAKVDAVAGRWYFLWLA